MATTLRWTSAFLPGLSFMVHPPPFSPPREAGQRVRQVHGARVVTAPVAGRPEGDAILLTGPGLAWVGVADCLAVALVGPAGCVLLHAGWRGLAAGVVEAGAEAVGGPVEAVVSPHATAAAYTFDPALARREFGPVAEVALARGPAGHTLSLVAILADRLGFAPLMLGGCTMTDAGWASRRRGPPKNRRDAMWI
ncbi:polyphenol oxidase family protein [bacterium]|nr:polyphenol oxidase family protein [bacterium]